MSDPIKLGGGSRFQPNDYLINRYCALVPSGTTLDDVLNPIYFQNYLDQMKAMMEVTVISEDMKLDARLRVMTVTKTTAGLRVLDVYAGDHPTQVPATVGVADVEVTWGGPKHKWRYLHGGEVLEFGFSSEVEATDAARKWAETING